VTVSVTETAGRHRASVDVGDMSVRCCEHGHAEAHEAAMHAWLLTRAIARKMILSQS
jgi:hypothetical protein